jgi:hypothetical protein
MKEFVKKAFLVISLSMLVCFLIWVVLIRYLTLYYGIKIRGYVKERRISGEYGYDFIAVYKIDNNEYESKMSYNCNENPVVSDSCDLYYFPIWPHVVISKYNSAEGCD